MKGAGCFLRAGRVRTGRFSSPNLDRANAFFQLNFPFPPITEPSLLAEKSLGSPLPWLRAPFPCQALKLDVSLAYFSPKVDFSLSSLHPRAFLSLLEAESWGLLPGEPQAEPAEQPRSQRWVTVTWLLAGRGGERGGGRGGNNCAIFPFSFFSPSSFFFPNLSQVTCGSVVKREKAEGKGSPSSGLGDSPSCEEQAFQEHSLWVH